MNIEAEMNTLYGQHLDPWKYRFKNRHAITVGACQSVWDGGRLLDMGCAEGHLTEMMVRLLDPRPTHVYAYDVAEEAVIRTAQNMAFCRDSRIIRWPMVSVEEADLSLGVPDGPRNVNLIVLSDVLTYLPDQADQLVQQCFERLTPGGAMVMTSWIDSHDHGDCFGDVPDGGQIEMEMTWAGYAMNLEHQTYDTMAAYRVLRRHR